jgi:glycogen(starch) synthase
MAVASGRVPTFNELIPEDAWVRLKRALHAQHRAYQPPIVTHDLVDDANDPVLNHLRHRHLFNAADDPVKVIFHPEFVTSTSPLIGPGLRPVRARLSPGDLPQLLRAVGLHTDGMRGVGGAGGDDGPQRLRRLRAAAHLPITPRRESWSWSAATTALKTRTEQLVHNLASFVQLNRRQRIELRNGVERLSETFDWSKLIHHYHDAHDLAISRTGGKRPGRMEVRVI